MTAAKYNLHVLLIELVLQKIGFVQHPYSLRHLATDAGAVLQVEIRVLLL